MKLSPKVLFVDDDKNLLSAIHRSLHRKFAVETVEGGAGALARLREGGYAVLVADMQMPVIDGLTLLKKAQEIAPDTVRIMLTGNVDQKTAVNAVNDGSVFRFLNKPCPAAELIPPLEAAIKQFQLICAERELLEGTLRGAVEVLMEILSTADPVIFQQSRLLAEHLRGFAQSCGIAAPWELELAAILCQLGRVTIPKATLEKERKGLLLTAEEREMLDRVPDISARLLQKIPRLDNVTAIVRYHQKNFDGTGVPPDSVAGEVIPIGARTLRVFKDLVELEAKSISKGTALQSMSSKHGFYDSSVLRSASRFFDVALEQPTTTRNSRQVHIRDLRPGQVVAKDIRTPEGVLILPADTELTLPIVEKLRNFFLLRAINCEQFVYDEQTLAVGNRA